jgi:hypothetical protein
MRGALNLSICLRRIRTPIRSLRVGFFLRPCDVIRGLSGWSSRRTAPPAAVPEPTTWALILAGFAAMGFAGYRRRNAAARFDLA